MIVSHLNAHVQSGLQWLDDVVVPGLRSSGKQNKYEIEVATRKREIQDSLRSRQAARRVLATRGSTARSRARSRAHVPR